MAFLAALPLTSIFSTAASVASAGFGIISSVASANYQAKLHEYNAQIAGGNAKRAEERAAIEAQDNDMNTLGLLGEQEAAQTSSGISLRSKSAVLTRRAARELGRRDTLNIVQSGDIEAYNYRAAAAGERAQGDMAKSAGRMNALGQFLSLGGSLVGKSQSTSKKFGEPSAYDPWEGLRRKTA